MRVWIAAAAVVVLAGCFNFSRAFECAMDEQCTGALGGVCEGSGYCSFADDACPSGQKYGPLAGPNAGQCTGMDDDGGIDGGGDAGVDAAGPTCINDGSDPVAPETYSDVAAGQAHTCAISADVETAGQVWCWGENANGQVGDGTTVRRCWPRRVVGLTAATYLSAGQNHTCAVATVGGSVDVYCWGANNLGQLGDGTTDDRLLPTRIYQVGQSFNQVYTGGDQTCGRNGNTAYCWGDNTYGADNTPGKLGFDGGVLATSIPTSYVDSVNNGGYHTMGIGLDHMCTAAAPVNCSGSNISGQFSVATPTGGISESGTWGMVSANVFAGGAMTCGQHSAVNAPERTLSCWGANESGQLGRGSVSASEFTVAQVTPAILDPSVHQVTDVSIGLAHVCIATTALSTEDPKVFCWGDNSFSQIGQTGQPNYTVPTEVTLFNGTEAVAVAAGSGHSCAVAEGGVLACWGDNTSGQLGRYEPTQSASPVRPGAP